MSGNLVIADDSANTEKSLLIRNTTVTSFLGVEGSSNNRFVGSAANMMFLGTTGADGIEFATNNNVRAVIDSSGYVGIGTTSPERALHVVGGIHMPNASVISFDQADGTLRNAIYVDSGDDMIIGDTNFDDIYFSTGQKTKTVVIKQTTGNVGIGDTSPEAPLHIQESYSTAYDGAASLNETLIISNSHGSDGSGVNNYSNLSFRVAGGATSYGYINYVRTDDNQGKFTFSQRQGSSTYEEHLTINNDGRVISRSLTGQAIVMAMVFG